jgi:hypothetical protein
MPTKNPNHVGEPMRGDPYPSPNRVAWDRAQMLRDLLRQVHAQPRIPLARASLLPRQPGMYLLFVRGPLPQYGEFQLGRLPIYAGKSESSLAVRGLWHKDHIAKVAGISVRNLSILALPLPAADAVIAERLMIDEFNPPWNRLRGFGARRRGVHRASGRSSPWNALHPGGFEDIPAPSLQLSATLRFASILLSYDQRSAQWSPLWVPPQPQGTSRPRRQRPGHPSWQQGT